MLTFYCQAVRVVRSSFTVLRRQLIYIVLHQSFNFFLNLFIAVPWPFIVLILPFLVLPQALISLPWPFIVLPWHLAALPFIVSFKTDQVVSYENKRFDYFQAEISCILESFWPVNFLRADQVFVNLLHVCCYEKKEITEVILFIYKASI